MVHVSCLKGGLAGGPRGGGAAPQGLADPQLRLFGDFQDCASYSLPNLVELRSTTTSENPNRFDLCWDFITN